MASTRVVHYNHTGAISGAERVLLQALPRLGRHGIQSTVLCPAGPLAYEAQQAGAVTHQCFALEARFTSNPVQLWRYLVSLAASVRSLRSDLHNLDPDVVHANSVRAGIVATLATTGSGTPVVWHVHDSLPSHPLSTAIRTVAAWSARTSQIAVSAATGRVFAGKLWKRRLAPRTATLHNSVDLVESSSTPIQRCALRRELGAEGRLLVGCVGQLCTRKNQIGLVELFRDVLRHEPDALLVIVGTAVFAQNAAYEQALRRRIAELGLERNVLMLGSRRDVPLLLETLDLLVLPSHSEPFSMILLEAAAAALPTVAFAVDGVPELLADRRTAWLIPPGEDLQMSRTIVWALRHPAQRRRLGEAARADLASRQTPDGYAAELARLLQDAAQPGHAAAERTSIDDLPSVHLGDAA